MFFSQNPPFLSNKHTGNPSIYNIYMALRPAHIVYSMDWVIPLQNLDISKINIKPPIQGTKLISSFNYSDDVNFTCLYILLPSLPVKSYDAATGKLQIHLQNTANTGKLNTFQDMLINIVHANQDAWFPSVKNLNKDELKRGFQPLIENGSIQLYCPSSSTMISNEISTYSGNTWSRGTVSTSIFSPGKVLRFLIKIQGLSFHQHQVSGMWSGKFRLQHRISAILF